MSIKRFLVLPHLKIHNANAMSSPYTIGFPAMTAWLGAVHAIERKMHALNLSELNSLRFLSTAISCHDFDLQTYRGENDYVSSIVSTANPLDKDGNRPAFVEEARCHLEVTLLIECVGLDPDHDAILLEQVDNICKSMKFASGDLLAMKKQQLFTFDEDDETAYQPIVRHLMLGHVLIERRDLMAAEMKQGADALDAMLNHLKIMHRSTQDDNGKVTWSSSRKAKGWIVPISVGFQGISPLEKAIEQRDPETPHRFAEAVLTLGEFVLAYKVGDDYSIEDILWQYQSDTENDLYLCQTQSITNPGNV
ncbi:MAG: type I-F CRISPR-associated protein Csy2 [Methylotenera sp.]|nr:type I-F CRISPR-associated protein Csy2 [Methylotenera sp.]